MIIQEENFISFSCDTPMIIMRVFVFSGEKHLHHYVLCEWLGIHGYCILPFQTKQKMFFFFTIVND